MCHPYLESAVALSDKASNELCLGLFIVLHPYCSRSRNYNTVCVYNIRRYVMIDIKMQYATPIQSSVSTQIRCINRTVLEMLTNIREYGSTIYVGLARAVSPTNNNFRLTVLLTRLQEVSL